MKEKQKLLYCATPSRIASKKDEICKYVLEKGFLPFHPFFAFPYEFYEGHPKVGRRAAMDVCIKSIEDCDEFGLFGVSNGTLEEIVHAIKVGKRIRLFMDEFDPEWEKFYQELGPKYGDPLNDPSLNKISSRQRYDGGIYPPGLAKYAFFEPDPSPIPIPRPQLESYVFAIVSIFKSEGYVPTDWKGVAWPMDYSTSIGILEPNTKKIYDFFKKRRVFLGVLNLKTYNMGKMFDVYGRKYIPEIKRLRNRINHEINLTFGIRLEKKGIESEYHDSGSLGV